jgi:hypothetical protein
MVEENRLYKMNFNYSLSEKIKSFIEDAKLEEIINIYNENPNLSLGLRC